MRVHTTKPLNAEPFLPQLGKNGITPTDLVFHRNHCEIPSLTADHRVVVEGLVRNRLEFTLRELLKNFHVTTQTVTLQCAGNRRRQMSTQCGHDTEGLQWSAGAVANINWTGIALRSVLEHCAVKPEASHVVFESHVVECDDAPYFGASIPLDKALASSGGPLLAYLMNGEPLTKEHGYPLRIVVPGYAGARSVKWVDKIIVSRSESQNFYQQRDYKVLPPDVGSQQEAQWDAAPALQALPLQSAITDVMRRQGKCYVRGYAIASEGSRITRVEVRGDRHDWKPARLLFTAGPWSWVLWEAEVNAHGDIYSRASDTRGTQEAVTTWNMRGVAYAGYGHLALM